jgi:BRCT domain type II-containing protein
MSALATPVDKTVCIRHAEDDCLLGCTVRSGGCWPTFRRNSSETKVNIYQTTRSNVPGDNHLHTRRCDKVKSHILHAVSSDLPNTKSSMQIA